MNNNQNKPIFLILFGLLLNISAIYSQTSNNNSLYNWFDKTIGKENLELYNGPRHVNFYRTLDNSHSYYFSKDYSNGDVNYQDQNYYNLDLKYDINNDILVLKAPGEYEYLGINLIKEKVAYFTLNNKKFVNINLNNPSCPDFMTGYYQETIISKDNILYTKHHKSKIKVIDSQKNSEGGNMSSTDEFKDKNEFILKNKDTYYKISSKSDLLKIFPQQKSEIKKYYNTYAQLEESDKSVFIENLIKEINSHVSNESN